MSEQAFSYVVIQYRRAPGFGEALNIGVVAYAPETGEIAARLERSYRRLSSAFEGFNGEMYLSALDAFEAGLKALQAQVRDNLYAEEQRARFENAEQIVRAVWADWGLSFGIAPLRYGVARGSLQQQVDALFEAFVRAQAPREDEHGRRDDSEVWRAFERALRAQSYLIPTQRVELGSKRIEFEHAFRNGKLHLIEPVSLDYAKPASMENKTFRVLGKVFSVREVQEVGTILVLVGAPRREENHPRYREMVEMMREQRPHEGFEVVEEAELERRVDEIARKLSLPRGATDDAH
ncbi:MAG: DUF3037 domain-containing protein [Fimbriimonadales bacterium]|nr:DUF3037 domain-containing protein [Fimbriimonadales bacterium]